MSAFVRALLPALVALSSYGIAHADPAAERAHVPYFEVRATPRAVVMVPLGEGDQLGRHLRVTLSSGRLLEVRFHSAVGNVVLSGAARARLPAFAPHPSDDPAMLSRVTASHCACIGADAATVHVTQRPQYLVPELLARVGVDVPVVPGGNLPEQPLIDTDEAAPFGWLELTIDTRTVPIGTTIDANVSIWEAGVPLSLRPSRVESMPAAQVIP